MIRRNTLQRALKLVFVALALVGSASSSYAQSPSPSRSNLQPMLDTFARGATPDQSRQLNEAVMASPTLADQLNALAASGKFKGFAIATPQTRPNSPFATNGVQGRIVFGPGFLEQVAKKRLFDVVHADDVLPNNLVFVLGSLAFQLGAKQPVMTGDMGSFMKAALDRDARSFLHGWNDMAEAAARDNGKPLTIGQIGNMMLNFRYRGPFITAMRGNKLSINSLGMIEPNEQNVTIMVEVLKQTQLLDFGTPPGQ